MMHLNTRRTCKIRANAHADALGPGLVLDLTDRDAEPERYALSTGEAWKICGALLRGILRSHIFAVQRRFNARRHP